ncbi:MAG: DUF58 domain-containing protein [Acidimicrobiales bacterium]|nr:DUF58 domain-containing protein [Acidimicrobiales bacterium]
MPVPTGRLAAAAAAVAVAVLLLPLPSPAAIVVLDGVLLALALLDAALAVSPGRVEVARDLPAVVTLGERAELAWTVVNPVDRRLHVAVADQLAPSLGAGTRRVRLALPPSGTATARTALAPRRRGRFRPRDVVVRVRGPLGLAARQATRALPGELRVYPSFGSKDEAELRIDRARILEVGLRSAQGRGGGTEFEQLREYTPDDEFRRIDWAATARSSKPIVRTYRAERNQTVLILLDNGRVMAGQVAGVPRVEHAMDAVLMLTAVASRLGDRVGLVAFDRRVRAVVAPARSARQLGRVSEALFELEPELAESDYRGAFVQALVRVRRRALVVLLTDLAEASVSDTLLPALPVLVRSHLVVIAGVRDPDVARWAHQPPLDEAGAYRAAAATAALDDRRRTVARLRGMGVTVVDALPGRLAPELADVYLRAKATGRL